MTHIPKMSENRSDGKVRRDSICEVDTRTNEIDRWKMAQDEEEEKIGERAPNQMQ